MTRKEMLQDSLDELRASQRELCRDNAPAETLAACEAMIKEVIRQITKL